MEKNPGQDELTSDTLKVIDEKRLNILVKLFNGVYREEKIPRK